MRFAILPALLALTATAQAFEDPIEWHHGPFSAAQRQASGAGELLLVYFWMDGSDFCAQVYGQTLTTDAAASELSDFICVSANAGVTFHARTLWKAAEKANLGRAIVVTHPDGENADFDNVLGELQEVFGNVVVPMTYPDESGIGFSEIHDVLGGDGPNAAMFQVSASRKRQMVHQNVIGLATLITTQVA